MNNSPLLKLPPELRVKILEYALITNETITVAGPRLFRDWSPPAALHICTQIRMEASQVYFGANIFAAASNGSPDYLAAWLDMLGYKQRLLIRKIHVGDRYYARQPEARQAVQKYVSATYSAGVYGVKKEVFHVECVVKGRKGSVWLNIPKFKALATH